MLLSFQIFLKSGVFAYYELNKDYIITNFCENVSRPQMKCNGKCYLKKQFKKADETDNNSQIPDAIKNIAELHPFIGSASLKLLFDTCISFSSASCTDALASSHLLAVFHPPEF